MIELTTPDGPLLVVPEEICHATPNQDGGSIVRLRHGEQDVTETVYDVARLRAAWELRFNSEELRREMPISVKMGGPTGILFFCCKYSRNARLEAEHTEAVEAGKD